MATGIKSMNISVIATVTNGKPKLSDYQKDKLNKVFKANEGKQIQIEVGRMAKGRSNNQNRYLWGAVYPLIADHTGYTTEELHELFKDKFLPKKFVKVGTVEGEVPKSSTKLNTVEFEEFIEKVRVFASTELSIVVPMPNE